MGGKKRRHNRTQKEGEKDLDRFAGSSEEEQESSDEEEQLIEEQPVRKRHKPQQQQAESDDDSHKEANQEQKEDETDLDPVVDDDDDDDMVVASGMAAAMSKILGTTPKPGTTSVVLSKTITPLQRKQHQEALLEKQARDKRRANRERNLTALHIPLSVATSTTVSTGGNNASAIAVELEQERTHRRVATRGVVALFNAIAQHQKKQQETQVSSTGESKQRHQQVKKLSKHGFLDMIKSAAAAKQSEKESTESNNDNDNSQQRETTQASKRNKWSALQDDYMLNSKLKDWDKESSDEEEEEGGWQGSDDDEPKEQSKPAKKQRVGR